MTREEWFDARRCRITASNAYRLLGKDTTLVNYAKAIAKELNGYRAPTHGLAYGDAGNEHEQLLIDEFYLQHCFKEKGMDVIRDLEIITHEKYLYASSSPDKVFKTDVRKFGLECKCKFDTPKNGDLSWRKVQSAPERNHNIQVQFTLWCGAHYGFDEWHILYAHIPEDFDQTKGIPEYLEYVIHPDEAMHAEFDRKVPECWDYAQQFYKEMEAV